MEPSVLPPGQRLPHDDGSRMSRAGSDAFRRKKRSWSTPTKPGLGRGHGAYRAWAPTGMFQMECESKGQSQGSRVTISATASSIDVSIVPRVTLLFLYGPPAAGKLTVARELAAITGLRVLYNHLTIELAHEVFPERTPEFGTLVARLRLELFETAARERVSVISTFVYAAGSGYDAFLAEIVALVERHGGKVAYVQLLPSRDALRARVAQASRGEYSKIQDWPLLESLLEGNDLTTPVPGSLTFDNAEIDATETAARIARHFGL